MTARTEAVVALFRSGKTLQEIGVVYGVSKQRIGQILATEGVCGVEGGQRVRIAGQTAERRRRRDARYLEKWGYSYAEYLALRGKPTSCFVQQRTNAAKRGVAWHLKFAEWWKVWQESGKWAERGRGHDCYVMSRYGDVGPYAVGNVYVQLADINSSEGPKGRRQL